ncbi:MULTISPECIES: TetR/AcrR family transcriptional regulator [unclassified Streptomyces]|uniref:TetR/AcrR family transcriptional regulator n=1 Tax=unclassified Streptomyces TaxID=2593676 RepID=UPI002252FE8D|nr:MULTISPECIES: TetR/AcrR family transcriptional regulator [unclassified Streptomyces]MCX5440761.1 TetR/AcrR family transcriptional regulator [Streptomyces sp. NBC_00063]WUB92870.1 TetR/AcrR family transcriptional regulator [Streptomyces sp. NBC_00569]
MTDRELVGGIVAAQRPRRADARRNFDALLAAARDAFAEKGAEASLEDIARQAGVGIGTLYRNFPTRRHLFETVYAGEVDALCRLADELADAPPWDGLATWLRRFVDYTVTKRAIRDALSGESDIFVACRRAMLDAGEPLLLRAQAAGEVRSDMSFDDLLRLVSGVTGAAYVDTEQRDRVFGITLDGMRTRPAPGKP